MIQSSLRGDDEAVGPVLVRVHDIQLPGAIWILAVDTYSIAVREQEVTRVELHGRDEGALLDHLTGLLFGWTGLSQ